MSSSAATAKELEDIQAQALKALGSGQLEEAIEHLRQCVTLNREIHQWPSLDKAQSLFTLALILFKKHAIDEDRGALAECAKLGEEALEIRRTIKGDIDASVAITSELVGNVYNLTGDLVGAESMFRLALKAALGLVGLQHVNTAKAQLQLASVLINLKASQESLEEAKELLEKCIESRKRVFGPASQETVAALRQLSNAYALLGQPEQAEATLNECRNLESLQPNNTSLDNPQLNLLAPSQQSMR